MSTGMEVGGMPSSSGSSSSQQAAGADKAAATKGAKPFDQARARQHVDDTLAMPTLAGSGKRPVTLSGST
jgi:hypothetical protein